jgi:hypothetical protein
MEMPRPLTARERKVLDFLVSIDGPAAEALRAQAATASVTGECQCGCGAIDLQVDRKRTPRAEVGRPVETDKVSADPEEVLSLLLWGEGGWISSIEVAWISTEPPGASLHPRALPHPRSNELSGGVG